MESQEQMNVVRSYYQLVDANDLAIINLFHEECTYERPGYDPMRGRDEIENFYRHQRVIKDGNHTLENVLADNGYVAVEGTFSGVLRNNDQVTLRFADFFVIEDAKVLHRRTYFFVPSV